MLIIYPNVHHMSKLIVLSQRKLDRNEPYNMKPYTVHWNFSIYSPALYFKKNKIEYPIDRNSTYNIKHLAGVGLRSSGTNKYTTIRARKNGTDTNNPEIINL